MNSSKNYRIDRTAGAAGLFAILSICVCLVLFYIDEGHYSLHGILQLTNLVGLGMYFIICFGFQLLFYWWLHRRIPFGLALLLPMVGLVSFFLIFYFLVNL